MPIVAVRHEDDLLERQHDAVVDDCARSGLAFLPWSPLARGRYAAEAALDALGARRGPTRQRLALAPGGDDHAALDALAGWGHGRRASADRATTAAESASV